MPFLNPLITIAALVSLGVLAGCASTRVEITGSPLKEPLCHVGAPAIATVVYWSPQWRPDQKEPPLREAAALSGIQDFLSRTSCLIVAGIHRLPAGDAIPSDADLARLVVSSVSKAERVLHIVVRELGPRITIGIPVVLEGETEVLIDVRVLAPQGSVSLADARTSWHNGGAFVIKGVKTLDQDMSAALSATLMQGGVSK